MSEPLRILILEDEPEHVFLMRLLLERDQLEFVLRHVMTEDEFLSALEEFDPQIVLADYLLPDWDGLSALAAVKQRDTDLPVIIVSGRMGEEVAIDSLKRGAVDYVLKTNLQRLPPAIRRAERERQQSVAVRAAQSALRQAHEELEQRVKDRTTELLLANSSLHEEIQDHQRTERDLRESRTLISAVFASLFGNVAVLDRAGVIIAVNDSWFRFGLEQGGQAERLGIGISYLEICRAAIRGGDSGCEAVLAGLEAVLSGSLPEFSGEYCGEAGGKCRWFQMVVTPLNRPEGGAVVTHVETTRHREAELQVQRLSHEVAHVGRVNMAGEMAGALAHELRQPLTAIVSNAEAGLHLMSIPGPTDAPELQAILTDVIAGGRRAGEVISRLRSLLRKGQSELRPVDLNESVLAMLPLCRGQATLHGISLGTELLPDLPPVQGDRIQLEQVLMNLVGNAIDALKTAAPGGRRVVVRTNRASGGGVELSVEDTGPGVPESRLEQIFESFVTSKPSGMGMGLSLCRSIAQSHGGRIWAANQPGGGAVFRLQLPACAGPVPASTAPPPGPKLALGSRATPAKLPS